MVSYWKWFLVAVPVLVSPEVLAQSQSVSVSLGIDLLLVAVSALLVFLMQAGFAMLESGMVRSKNTVNVLMKNYIDLCVVTMCFWVIGYGLMWGQNTTGFFGTTGFLVNDGSPQTLISLFYQTMFAATAVTIISGAVAERVTFSGYILIAVLVSVLVYPVYGSWVWGPGGWLKELGFFDFAGATVVHSVGGWSALAALLVLGPRLGRYSEEGHKRPILGHNLVLVALGGFLLWFGWFGFNMGSLGKVDGLISLVLLNTNLAGAAGGLAGVMMMMVLRVPVLMTHTVVAMIGGLVAITAGASVMTPVFAALTGFIGGGIAILGIDILDNLGIDDAVGAVSCHAFSGFWGTLSVGLFYTGDLFNLDRIVVQLSGALICMLWSFLVMYGLLKLFGLLFSGIRVNARAERRGLDYTEHYEVAYPEFQRDVVNPGKQSG